MSPAQGMILVVDDESVQRNVLAEMLRLEGYGVHEASSGEEALEMCGGEDYALLLIDVTMPGMGGLALLERLKDVDPAPAAIMVSGRERLADARKAMELGACGYVSKPVSRNELTKNVHNALTARMRIREELRYRQNLEREVRRRTRQIQEALETVQDQRRELDTIVNSMHAGIVVVDFADRVTMINNEARRIIGAGESRVVGSPVVELIRRCDRARLSRVLRRPQSHHTPLTLTVDNRRRHFTATVSALFSADGTARGKVIALLDQTDKVRMEEFRNSFLSIVAHELRTPLSVLAIHMTNFNEVLDGNPRAASIYDDMKEASRRLEYLVENIIAMAHLSVGTSGATLEEIDLSRLLRARLESLTPAVRKRELSVSASITPSDWIVLTDSRALGIVLDTLLSNAVKFNRQGGELRVAVRRDSSEGFDVMHISVEDTGHGVPPRLRERIFEDFYQIENPLTRMHEGAGLGLCLTRRALDVLGGDITVAESPEGGGRFDVRIPVERACALVGTRASAKAGNAPGSDNEKQRRSSRETNDQADS